MSKKVNYFAHDYGARNDPKIIAAVRKCEMAGFLGGAGKGAFWDLVEMLHEAGGKLDCDAESLENLAYSLRYPLQILHIVIFECDLFIVENNKFYSKRANEGLQKMSEASERGKQLAQKRWGKQNDEKSQNCTQNMRTAYENDATRIADSTQEECDTHCSGNASAMLKKEINKKIKKEINKEKDISDVDTPDGGETVETNEKSLKNIFSFNFFINKFPKQTRINEAKMAFLNLSNDEREKLAKVYNFWLSYWETIDVIYVPNPFDFLKNKRFLDKIPEKFGSKNPEPKTQPQVPKFPSVDERKLTQESENRKKMLEFFENLPDPKKQEITGRVTKKFEKYPAVKPGDILWQIEIARWVKPLFEAEKSKIGVESF